MSPESDFSVQWLSDTFYNNSLHVHARQPQSINTSFCHVEDVFVLLYIEFNDIYVQIMLRWRQFCTHTTSTSLTQTLRTSDIFTTWADALNIALFDSNFVTGVHVFLCAHNCCMDLDLIILIKSLPADRNALWPWDTFLYTLLLSFVFCTWSCFCHLYKRYRRISWGTH